MIQVIVVRGEISASICDKGKAVIGKNLSANPPVFLSASNSLAKIFNLLTTIASSLIKNDGY